MNFSVAAFLGIANQVSTDLKAAAPEQSKKAAENTEVRDVTPPKSVDYVKKRPEEVPEEEALKELPELPAQAKTLIQEERTLREKKNSILQQLSEMSAEAGMPAIDQRLAEIPRQMADLLSKYPNRLAMLEDLIASHFTRVVSGSEQPNLTKEEIKVIEKLNKRIEVINKSLDRAQAAITKIEEEAFAKRGGSVKKSEHVQYFPDPKKRHPRGEASTILQDPIKPFKAPLPKAPGTPAAPAPQAQASLLDQINILRGCDLDAAQQARLQQIQAGVMEMFKKALQYVKDLAQAFMGVDEDVNELEELFRARKAGE
jgi:hypothetical protein